jgi:hypothetical protein
MPIDEVVLTPRHHAMMKVFQRAIKEDRKWYHELMNSLSPSDASAMMKWHLENDEKGGA